MPPPRICVLMSRRFGAGRRVIRGIMDGLGERSEWLIDLHEPLPHASLAQHLARAPAGILASHLSEADIAELKQSGIPAVLTGASANPLLPTVSTDDRAIADIACSHFANLRFTKVAWLGWENDHGTDLLGTAFAEASRRYGLQLLHTPPDVHLRDYENGIHYATESWLRSLPTGTALFTVSDLCAWQVLQCCHRLGISVPGKLAVLGSNNDDLLCSVCEPPLSSVATASRRIGAFAVKLLIDWIKGHPPAERLYRIQPDSLVQRQSSATVATKDELVRWAVDWIRTNLRQDLTIKQLVFESGVSRRTLESRFKDALGRSPLAEIHRQQSETAHSLITIDRMTPAQAAERVGLSSSQQLNRLFRKHYGKTPISFAHKK